MMKKILAVCALLVGLTAACGSGGNSGGGGTTVNDKVFTNNSGYTEVFKDEGNGKNYMYTYSEFDNANSEHCTVVTGDSEHTIAVSCTPKAK